MGIEPTQKLEIKRLPEAGGTVRSASELIGIIIGRELDVHRVVFFKPHRGVEQVKLGVDHDPANPFFDRNTHAVIG
jgi:hypothetical protein